jgi:hypothetical protein
VDERRHPGSGDDRRDDGERAAPPHLPPLDLWLRPDRTLQQAVAGPDADLTMMPGPKDPREKKRLRSEVLDFVFDDKGKLEELTALKDTLFTTEAIPPAKAPRKPSSASVSWPRSTPRRVRPRPSSS